MVFFTCNNCGESIKKPSVAKHYMQKCRGAEKNVSCMDCQKDFRGEEYDAHTRCISEEEKYSGKDYVPKENKNAGQKKQDSWMEIVRAILGSKDYALSSSVRGAFQKLQHYDNVPRKQAKFQNFVKNCLRMDPRDAQNVWKILSQELDKIKQSNVKANQAKVEEKEQKSEVNGDVQEVNGNDNEAKENGNSEEQVEKKKKSKKKKEKESEEEIEEPKEKKKSKKRPAEEEVEPETETKKVKEVEVEPETKEEEEFPVERPNFNPDLLFDWSGAILNQLNKKDEIALEKLKKKVVKKYLSHSKIEVSTEKQERKINKTFTKYLKKCNLNVTNEIVKLVQ
ncbi:LYAR family protein [Megaselia abdita]